MSSNEVNFPMDQVQTDPPADRLKMVYLILLLHGIGTLMPWNMFITAKSYFEDYKLSKNYTGVESTYVTNFMPYVGTASTVPNLLFNWINIFLKIGGSLTVRIVWSLAIEVIMFLVTVFLAIIDSSKWPGIFFWLTMGTVFVLNMANGIYQNTLYGMAAKLPFKYTGAIIVGNNVCGTLTALINIVSITAAPSARTAAIYYFLTALFVLLGCLITYFSLPLVKFYCYYEMLEQKQVSEQRDAEGVSLGVPFLKVFFQSLPQCFNVFFIFFVTLTVFPTVYSDIKRADSDFFISEKYFTLLTCFLTFNLWACIGSLLSAFRTWPGPRWVVVPVLLRVIFIPIFLVFNYHPYNVERAFPVLVTNEWVYWITAVLFSSTSGYFSSVCMMYCPRQVEPKYAATAGMFGAACLVTGVFAGITFSTVMPWFVQTVG